MPLSDFALRSAKPTRKPFKLSGGGGLHLLVQANGAKLWRFAYRFAGKQKLLSFGAYPTIPLADAREKRERARKHLLEGTDPSVARKLEKATHAITFRIAASSTVASLGVDDLDNKNVAACRFT